MDAFCSEVLRRLEAGTPLVLVTVMDQQGSAPRAAGARMLVAPDGGIAGTVGGGRYEAEAIAASLDMHGAGRSLRPGEAAPAALMHYSLKGAADMDMICGGALTLLLEYVADTPEARAVYGAGKMAEEAGLSFVLGARIDVLGEAVSGVSVKAGGALARLADGSRRPARTGRFIWVAGQGVTPPETVLDKALADGLSSMKGGVPRLVVHGDGQYLLEPFARPFRLVIFGGGHVSRETAALARNVGFHVTVAEDRPEFADPARFPGCAARLLPSLCEADCAALLGGMLPGPCDGVVILTRGHSHDKDALAAAVRTGAGYIGMIGSRSKRAAVYASLKREGVAEATLAAVHSPIGLAIGAETPAEIAVSIVGELIAWRNTVLDSHNKIEGH